MAQCWWNRTRVSPFSVYTDAAWDGFWIQIGPFAKSEPMMFLKGRVITQAEINSVTRLQPLPLRKLWLILNVQNVGDIWTGQLYWFLVSGAHDPKGSISGFTATFGLIQQKPHVMPVTKTLTSLFLTRGQGAGMYFKLSCARAFMTCLMHLGSSSQMPLAYMFVIFKRQLKYKIQWTQY